MSQDTISILKVGFPLDDQWAEQVLQRRTGEVAWQKANWHFRNISSALSRPTVPYTPRGHARDVASKDMKKRCTRLVHAGLKSSRANPAFEILTGSAAKHLLISWAVVAASMTSLAVDKGSA